MGSGARVTLVNLEKHKLSCTIRFGLKVSNNVAEYMAQLVGLRLSSKMQVKRLIANSDSQLAVPQGIKTWNLTSKESWNHFYPLRNSS